MNTAVETRTAPGPKGHFLLGSLPERSKRPLEFFMQAALKYGDIVRFKMGPKEVFLLASPEYVKYLLLDNNKNYPKGINYTFLEPVLGKGLLTSEGDFWKRQRKLAQPAFHRQKLSSFVRMMTESTARMLSQWDQVAAHHESMDVASEMMKVTLTIVGRTLLGSEVAEDTRVVSESLPVLLEGVNQRILSILPPVFHRIPTPWRMKLKRAEDSLKAIVQRIITERRRLSPEENEARQDLLSMFMAVRDEETGEGMTDQELQDEAMTIFLAGHETTANLLAWTFFLLSRNPVIERRVCEEISVVLGSRAPTLEDFAKMPFGSRVLEEALRLYPPAWMVAREAKEEDVIGGFKIPRGAIMLASAYVTQRVPKYWDNPEGFDPDRFSDEESAKRHKFAWFPFGGGPRVCIGSSFAMMEAQLILTMVLQKFRLDLVPGHIVTPEALITLRPKYGVQVTLRPRSQSQGEHA